MSLSYESIFHKHTMVQLGFALVVCSHVACTKPISGGTHTKSGATSSTEHQHPLEAVLTNFQYGKPPLAYLTVDVKMHNDSPVPRWFLIPTSIPRIPGPPSSGVYAVEVSAIGSSQAKGMIGRLHGIDSAYVVLIPSGGEMTVKNLQIAYWRPEKWTDSIQFLVRVAKEVLVGTEPIQQWLDVDLLNGRQVEGDYVSRKLLGRRERHGYKEVPLILDDEVQLMQELPLILPTTHN